MEQFTSATMLLQLFWCVEEETGEGGEREGVAKGHFVPDGPCTIAAFKVQSQWAAYLCQVASSGFMPGVDKGRKTFNITDTTYLQAWKSFETFMELLVIPFFDRLRQSREHKADEKVVYDPRPPQFCLFSAKNALAQRACAEITVQTNVMLAPVHLASTPPPTHLSFKKLSKATCYWCGVEIKKLFEQKALQKLILKRWLQISVRKNSMANLSKRPLSLGVFIKIIELYDYVAILTFSMRSMVQPLAMPVAQTLLQGQLHTVSYIKKYPPATICLKTSKNEQLFFFLFGPLQNRTHTMHKRNHFLTLAAPINGTHTLEKRRSVPRSECLQFLLFLPTFVSHIPFSFFPFHFPSAFAIKGAVSRYSVIFALFLREEKMATARASVADISSVSRANSFTAPAESRKCRFPRAIVDFRGLALWPPLFFPTQNGCQTSPTIVTLPL